MKKFEITFETMFGIEQTFVIEGTDYDHAVSKIGKWNRLVSCFELY